MTSKKTGNGGEKSDPPAEIVESERASLEQLKKRLKEVEGDPEKARALLRETVLEIIDEVRQRHGGDDDDRE